VKVTRDERRTSSGRGVELEQRKSCFENTRGLLARLEQLVAQPRVVTITSREPVSGAELGGIQA
jgi:hypothetical protein